MTKIFAISLPRSEQRHRHIREELARKTRLPTEILGIDGRELRQSGADWPHNPDLRDSQVGCALSHVETCRRIVAQDLPSALVIEDDVTLPENIDRIVASLADLIAPAEVISLYNRTLRPERFSTCNAVNVEGMRLLYPMESRYMRTAAAYYIDRAAAEGIAAFNFPVRVLADDWMAFYQAGVLQTLRLLHPIPVKLKPFPSTLSVDRGSPLQKVAKKVVNASPFLLKLRELRRRAIETRRETNVVLVDLPSDQVRNRL
jgi:glycosyl transferase family 25